MAISELVVETGPKRDRTRTDESIFQVLLPIAMAHEFTLGIKKDRNREAALANLVGFALELDAVHPLDCIRYGLGFLYYGALGLRRSNSS